MSASPLSNLEKKYDVAPSDGQSDKMLNKPNEIRKTHSKSMNVIVKKKEEFKTMVHVTVIKSAKHHVIFEIKIPKNISKEIYKIKTIDRLGLFPLVEAMTLQEENAYEKMLINPKSVFEKSRIKGPAVLIHSEQKSALHKRIIEKRLQLGT